MKKNTKTAKTTAAAKNAEPKTRDQFRRSALSELSAELKAKNPDQPTNALLIAHYAAKLGSAVFDTFEGWTKRGRAVKRGEKAVAIWKPAEDNGKSRWLMEFLFAETQTTERHAAKPAASADAAAAVATA